MNNTAIAPLVATSNSSIGLLAKTFCLKLLPLEVLRSPRGFYIGTSDEEGPCSRESVQYWPSLAKAEQALTSGMWTQRIEP